MTSTALDPRRSAIVQAYQMSSAQFDVIKDQALRPALRSDESIRLFPEEGLWGKLEHYTYAEWWLPLCTWFPACAVIFWYTPEAAPGYWWLKYAAIALGWFMVWPLLEYLLHRFIFHAPVAWATRWGLPRWMQGSINVARLLLHTVHHAHPTDRRRIVTPLAMSLAITCPVLTPLSWALPRHVAMPMFIGIILGYVQYDWTHYSLHCGVAPADLPDWTPWKAWFQRLHKAHANHHHGTFGSRQSFGVAHETPDKLFGTSHEQ